jgi:2-keto-4-pentenoate hydratase/2-oxohepta-3-ene-1,7-dioic acid hydratase in catechol pathway
MILATFCLQDGIPRVGVVRKSAGTLVDVAAAHAKQSGENHAALDSMLALMQGGEDALELVREIEAKTLEQSSNVYQLQEVRLLAPVPEPTQMRDFSVFELHMQQAAVGMARIRSERLKSTEPLPKPSDIVIPEVFYKQPVYYKANRLSVVGHEHEILWPPSSRLFDYELEFGIYIGKAGRDIPVERAHEHIFGYTVYNDFSARDAQEYEMSCPFGPAKGKDFDTGNAMGPWIVTPDEITNPAELTMIARVNGEEWSRNSSRAMIHSFEEIIAHVSRDETLQPGEFFGSGTAGGGCGLELNRWLQPGDTIELEVENIGVLRNRVVRAEV